MKDKAIHVICQGISYHKAPVSLRGFLAQKKYVPKDIFLYLKKRYLIDEILLLSTCNRFEIYFTYSPEASWKKEHTGILFDLCQKLEFLKTKEATLDINSFVYNLTCEDAVSHIFKVVSSLDSMCVGETQIIYQFKNAVENAKKEQTLSCFLERLSQQALFVSKSIRRQTSISQKPVSLSHLAVDLAREFYHDYKERVFVLIGAGVMVELALGYLKKMSPKKVFIVNRSPKRAEDLIKKTGIGVSKSFLDLEDLLFEADAVISSTASSSYLLTYLLMNRIQKKRKGRSLCLVDIALPRDIDPACSALEDVYLFDLDDLGHSTYKKEKINSETKYISEKIIDQNTSSFMSWLANKEKTSSLGDMDSYLLKLFSQEFQRSFPPHKNDFLAPGKLDSIQLMLNSIRKKIVSDAALSVGKSENLFLKKFLYPKEKHLQLDNLEKKNDNFNQETI